jgi:MFS family permease
MQSQLANDEGRIISGHSITVALILPLAGGLSDIFGRKWFFVGGCLFSLTGTVIALAAKDIPTVIAGMVLKGVGSGGQQLS